MMSLDEIRKAVAAAEVGRDPYGVARGAGMLLGAEGGDAVGRECYAKALGVLKLTGARARFLGEGVGAGGGVIPWTSRARRFGANLKLLEARTAAGADAVRRAAEALNGGRYELHQAGDGNFQVLDVESAAVKASGGWLGGLADHKAATGMWAFDRAKAPVPPPMAFDGVGFGWLWMHVIATTERSYLQYSCAVYVLESDPLGLAMMMHMHDLAGVIGGEKGERVRWFIGGDVLKDFREGVLGNRAWTVPGHYVRCALRERPAVEMEGAIQALREAREKERAGWIAANEKFYEGKGARYWSGRVEAALRGDGEPLRVLGITSRYTTVLQHSMAELRAAVQAVGGGRMEMDVVMEPDDHSLEHPFVERIAAMKPDLIVQLSRMRYENPGIPREVPFLCWDQDNLPCMRTEAATASLTDRQTGALTYVAGHGAIFGFGHLDWPEGNCIFCHAAGATHRYAAEPVAADLLEKYTCDISYVSNASDGPGVLAGELRGHWDKHEALLGVFEECAREIFAASEAGRCWDDVSLGKLLLPRAQAVGLEQGSAVYHEMAMDLHRYADRCLRHVTLGWVSRWCAAHGKTLRLYGKGWERHAELGQWAAGLAGQGEELRAIYQASRINLQIIESGFIHARSLDGLAAGGFFLTRHVPADGEDVGLLRDVYLLGRWVVEKGITSPAEIEASGDAEVMGRWKRTLAYHTWTPEHAVRVLKVWAKTPAPAVAFPMLPEISFQDEAGFGRLAEAFLGDEGRRREMAGRMRQIVLHEFSYDSRWKEFLAHVVRGLKVAAGAPSRSQEF